MYTSPESAGRGQGEQAPRTVETTIEQGRIHEEIEQSKTMINDLKKKLKEEGGAMPPQQAAAFLSVIAKEMAKLSRLQEKLDETYAVSKEDLLEDSGKVYPKRAETELFNREQ